MALHAFREALDHARGDARTFEAFTDIAAIRLAREIATRLELEERAA